MASSEDLYSLAYQQALAESQSAEDLALKYDAVSPYTKKLLNSVRTADVLMEGVAQHKLEKQANMDGYRKGYILFDGNSDADSGTAIDAETGEAFNYRFNAFNQYDAGDKLESVLKSPSKSWNQPQFVLKMYGLQNFDGLTEEQKGALFTNVKNYHFQQMRNSLLDPNYKGEKFDPDTIYAAPTKERIEFMYKNTGGLDRYNRYLIDAINPATGRSVVFDTAQNPYLNEKFDFYKAINSNKNIKRLERWEKQGDVISNTSFTTPTQAIENYRDNTSLLGQTYDKFDYAVDLAKSSFVGEFTKFISSDRAKKMGVDKVFDVEGWKKLDERLEKENQTGIRGQIFTAVNKEADKFYENMQKEWGKGNYFASAKNALGFLADYIGMMPEFIGQSAGQTGVGIAIGAAVGSAVPGAGTAGGAMLGLAASVLGQGAYTALSNTLDTLENFKKNNGKEMSWDETLQTFGEYLGAATYEAGLDRVFLGRLFGRSKLGQKLFGKPSKILEGKNSLQAGGLAALSEIPQEGWESTIDAYHSQKEGPDRLSRLELATSPEVVKQAIGGGVAGFGMGAGLTGLSRLGTGRTRKALEQDIAKQQQYNEAKTITGADANVEASNDFLSNLKTSSFDDKLTNLSSNKITPEAAHAEAEKIRTTLDNTDTAYNRNAYYAGIQEANQWDLAAAQYYKDQGLSNDEIEQKLGVNLEDLFGNVIQGSNLNSRRLYEQGMQLDDTQYQAEEERLKKVGENLGLDKEFIESAIENVNENVRYGGAGYHTYSDRVMNNLNRLKTESLTPESKQLLEIEVTDNLTGMFRIYTDQAHKVSELMHAAEKLAATNERQADTSWMHRNKAFTVNRVNLANGSYNSKSGVYAIFRNAVEDLRTIEAKTNDLIKAGVPAELIQNAMKAVSKETDHPRKMAPWGIADSLETRFKNAALSLKTQARDQSKFSGKDFNVDDLTSSLTYLTKSTNKTKDSAKYNQAFQNLHYAFTQKPEMVDALKTKVNGWKNEALKQKALGEIDRIAAYRDEIGTESEARKAQHDPYVKSMKTTLDEIDKLYIQDNYDESGETNESRMQKLRKQAGYLDRLQKLRANFQAVIDTNNKEDIALRDHLDKTIGEVQKKVALFSSNRSGQETGKGKFKDNVKNFISSIKRLANKKVLETQLKSLQKKYDNGVLKGHSDELLGEIQAKITAVQDRLNELNNQEEPKLNPKPNQTAESTSETATEEEPEEEEDFLVQEIKKSTDISWLESTRDNLAASNPNDHRVSRYTELINKRIEEVKASDTKKPTRTAFNASYNYGEYNSLRNDPTFVALVSAIINDSSIAPNVTFKRISYFLSDEFEAKLKDKNLSEKELKKFQKELVRLTEAITEIKNSLSNKNNKEHIDKLLDKVVQKILPKLQKDYNRQVREAYKEAKNELEQSTIWRLVKGEYGKISYDSLVKVTDKQTANALRKKLPKLIVKEGGLSLDLIANNTDNDLGQAERVFEGNPSKVAEMLYQTIAVDEKTLNGEARKQAQDSAKTEEAKLEAFKENPKSILYGHLNRLLQAMDMRLQSMDQVISGDARISREDGSGSTGRGGDGNSSTTPSGSDSTASQAPNSGNAPNTPSGASQSDQNGQGVQTPMSAPQGSQNGSQRPSQGSQAQSLNVWYGTGENAQFSNLAERPFTYEGRQYKSVEHAYQSLKSGSFDEETYNKSWQAGVKIKGNKGIDKANNLVLMKNLILESFKQNENAKQALIATGTSTFIHNNPSVDAFWNKEFPRLLTEVRQELSSIANEGITEDEAANLTSVDFIDNNFVISDEEYAEVSRMFGKKPSINSLPVPNTLTREEIDKRTVELKTDTSKYGTESVVTNTRLAATIGPTISTSSIDKNGNTVTGTEKIPFDLTTQIKMGSEEAASYLAYDYRLYANQPWKEGTVIDGIHKIANKIKLNLTAPNLKQFLSQGKFYNKETKQYEDNEAIISKNVAFRLLYDLIIDDKGNPKTTFNDFTLTLVDYSLREYLAESDILEYFTTGTLTSKQLAILFGLDENQLSYADLEKLRAAVKENGIPRSVIINSLGMRILNNMGIIENKETSNYGVFARLASSLGCFAVDYGEAMGLYTLTEFEPRNHQLSHILSADTISTLKVENSEQRYNVRYAQITYTGNIDDTDPNNKVRRANGLNQFKNPKSNYNTDAVWDGSKIDYTNKDKDVFVKHSSNLTKVSDFRREVMQRQSDIVWRFDTDITDFFDGEVDVNGTKMSGWEALKLTMGYMPQSELDLLSHDGREAAKGVNLTIEKEIKALREGIEKQKAFLSGRTKNGKATTVRWTSDNDGIRFKHFWASNGRLYIDCSEMNPQTMKLLRFTLMAKGMHYTYDPSLATSNNIGDRQKWKDIVAQENFAITQAFDMLGSTEKTNAFAEAMKELSVDQLKAIRTFIITKPGDSFKYAVEGLIKNNEGLAPIKGIGRESIPQALNAITHLIRRKESNGKAFDTTLVAEDDSTTSGYVIKMLQMPFSEIVGDEKNFLSKVGIQEVNATTVDSIMPIHEIKKLKTFQDIYRTTAAEVSDEITDLLDPNNEKARERAFSVEFRGELQTVKKTSFLNETFMLFGNALPKKEDDGTISGAFRLLMKPAVMVFGYSAGIDSISANLAGMVMKEFIQAYTVLQNKYKGDYTKYVDSLGIDTSTEKGKQDYKKEEAKIKAIKDGMENIAKYFIPREIKEDGKTRNETFMEALQNRSYSTIELRLPYSFESTNSKNLTLQDCFNDLIGNTYGRLAGEALEKMFEPYIEANELMINMSNTMADSFIKIYKHKLKVLVDKARAEKRKPTTKEVEALKEELKSFLPTISLADDTYVQNIMKLDKLTDEQTGYMTLTKFDKAKNNMNMGANYYTKNGKLVEGTHAYGNELMPTHPVRAGAVIPIHCLDGSILAKVIKEFSPTENYEGIDINGVFDALITSAFVSNEVANAYNRNLFEVNRDHNILADMFDHFNKFCEKAFDYEKATGVEVGVRYVKDSKGENVAKEYKYDKYTGTRRIIPISIDEFLGLNEQEGYKKKRGDVVKKVNGILPVLKKLSRDREAFYSRSWAISNLDASSIRGSYLASNESELVASFAHRNARINDVVNTNIDNIPAFIKILADDPFLTEEYEQKFRVYKYADKHIPFDQTFDNFFKDINNANNKQIDAKKLASKYSEDIKKLNKEISKESKTKGSSPNSYQTNGAINNIYHKALDDPEERANIVDYVQNLAASLGNKLCSDKHVARLKELVRSIAPERIRGTVLDIADNGRWAAGQYDPDKKHIQLVMDDRSASRLLDSKTKLCVLSLLAPAEIYAHEVLHAGNEFAFTHRGVFGFNSQIRKLLAIQEEAKKVITWKDFMPADGTFDESLRPYYERHARAFHNYIFVEQDPKTLASLNEFCSFVATNENLRAKLTNVTINQPTMNPNANLVDRLIAVLKGIYDVIFSKKKFSEVFTRTYKVLKGDSTGKTVSLLDEFDRLHRQLHTANHKAVNSLFAQPMKYFETFLSVTDELTKSGNEKIHGYLHKMFNFHEIKRDEALAKAQEARQQKDDAKEKAYIEEAAKHIPQVNIATNATKWEITKELGKLAKTIVTSGEARKNMRMIMRDLTRTSQQGLWMSTYRDFMGPDEGTSIFEALGMRLRMVDKISKNQEATAMKVLQDAFGRPLNDYENTALANAFLYTDAQSLYDGQNLGEVVSFLKDPNLRKQNISQILDTFKQKLSPRDYSWLQYSAVSTAYHMVHSIGNPLLNLNAKNIAEGRGWDHSLNLTDAEIAQLDKLITLYALDNTSQEFLDVTATLPAKGIEQFLKMHKEFVDESKYGYKDVSDSGQVVVTPFMEATNVMKGYTKTMTDPSIESVIAVPDATDPEAMKKQGYDDKMTLTADGIVNSKDAHVYTRFGISNRRDGNTVSVQGHNAMGKTLMQFAFSEEDQLDVKNGLSRDDETRKREAIKRWRAMRKKADDNLVNLRNDVIAASKNNKEFTFEDISKIINQYSSFSPIYNDKVAGPADYRQTLARDIKRQHLGLDERGLTILSRMFGSVTRQIYGAGANKVLLEFTKDYMKKNMNFMTNMDMQGHKFVKIEKDSPNKYLRESWKVIPENFKEYAKNNNLYIREDWLQDYFGVSNYTLLDNDKVKRHTGYLVKRGIAIAEMIMKTIAYARKQAIVLKIPGVLVGNIVSNLMFSIMNHRNPIKVIKTTIANAQAIRDYIENRKALDCILFKTRLGTVTAEETSQIPALRRKIENNIVKPLMEKGMYQSIIEDMQSDELESIGKVNKWLKHNKIAQKLPPSVKNTFKTVFMMEGTPAYDFMFIATQYSDFIARCTEYQLSMDEVPAEYERAKKKGTTKETLSQFMERREKEISTMITNAFINYDKPQSKFEQYMNDLGLIMFSKFGKRIQSVIKNQLYHRPIHALLFLMSQVTFIDTEDILEQNLFNKNWLNLMHSPIDNFIGAAIPMPIQIMFGDQKAF